MEFREVEARELSDLNVTLAVIISFYCIPQISNTIYTTSIEIEFSFGMKIEIHSILATCVLTTQRWNAFIYSVKKENWLNSNNKYSRLTQSAAHCSSILFKLPSCAAQRRRRQSSTYILVNFGCLGRFFLFAFTL